MSVDDRTGRQPLVALYVPGDRPDRFAKALASGADLVIVDLEDAVAPADKVAARESMLGWLADDPAAGRRVGIEIRVNAGDCDDVGALAALGVPSERFGVRVPKVESAADLDEVAAVLPGVALTALVETAAGVEALGAIAAHPAVAAVALGEADLASDVGAAVEVLDYARVRLLYAARAAGLARPMMSVYAAIADLDGLRTDTERGRTMGFFGRTAVHPSQVPVIRAAFSPTAAEVAWAREVVAATEGGGVATLASGEMVDPAMIGRARAVLALAAATKPDPPAP